MSDPLTETSTDKDLYLSEPDRVYFSRCLKHLRLGCVKFLSMSGAVLKI